MPTEPLDIDVAGATAALEAAGGMPETIPASSSGVDPWARQQAPTPAQSTAPPANAETPPTTPETGIGSEGEPSFSKLDPAALPPELNQLYRGMQGEFTKGQQEIAPWRKLAEETGIENPEDIRAALETYQRLQDPSNWQQIHSELGQYMQNIGMTPAQANAAATEAIAEFAPSQEVDDFSEFEGTELAPVLQAMQRLEKQNQALQARFEQQEAQRVEVQRFQQVAAHIEKQEVALRASRPDYTDNDYENIYSLMGDTPDLQAAADRYEAMLAVRLQRYIGTKEGGLAAQPTPLAGGGVVTQNLPDARPEGVDPVEWGHAQAMRQIAAMDRADAQS